MPSQQLPPSVPPLAVHTKKHMTQFFAKWKKTTWRGALVLNECDVDMPQCFVLWPLHTSRGLYYDVAYYTADWTTVRKWFQTGAAHRARLFCIPATTGGIMIRLAEFLETQQPPLSEQPTPPVFRPGAL